MQNYTFNNHQDIILFNIVWFKWIFDLSFTKILYGYYI